MQTNQQATDVEQKEVEKTALPSPTEAWLRYCVFSSNGLLERLLNRLDPHRTVQEGKLAVPPPGHAAESQKRLFNLRQPDNIPDAETRAALRREAPIVKLTSSPQPNYASTDSEASEKMVQIGRAHV